MVALPYNITNGNSVDAVPVMANLNVLAAAIEQISDAQIIADAGIDRTKLKERFSEKTVVISTVPFTSGASIVAPGFFACPVAQTIVHTFRVSLQAGQVAFLALVEHFVDDTNPAAPDYPNIDTTVGVGGVFEVIGGAVHQIDTDDAFYTNANAAPLSSPLIPLNDGDEIKIRIGATSGAPGIRAVDTRIVIKSENIS